MIADQDGSRNRGYTIYDPIAYGMKLAWPLHRRLGGGVNGAAATVELLAQLVTSLPPSDEAEAALHFLKQPDLIYTASSQSSPNCHGAAYWLRIFMIRQKTTAGLTTYGCSSFLAALERLPPAEPITMTTFQSAGWFGSFWLNQESELIGFILVAKRAPEQEEGRLDWFSRHFA